MMLLLAHGWGFDADFWRPLRAALPEVECLELDFGHTGHPFVPSLPEGRPLVGVGHSLGFAWLLRRLFPWAGLVSINGFARFTQGGDFPHGTPPRVIERMRARLAEAPETVHGDFMARLAAPAAAPKPLSQPALADGLAWLAEWDERPALAALEAPLLALAAADDPLVPEAMARQTFPADALRLRSDGGHLLPLTQPEWCAAELRAFLGRLR